MYSQNPVHINTVFLITLFSGFFTLLGGEVWPFQPDDSGLLLFLFF